MPELFWIVAFAVVLGSKQQANIGVQLEGPDNF